MIDATAINPFFAARSRRAATASRSEPDQAVYARLPRAPKNASPVPHLTSLYHFHRAGEYGDRGYPGNCGGNLIKDLLRYFRPNSVFDPATGSGTCRDVCEELDIYCWSSDLHQGADACDASQFPRACFEFCWLHPPDRETRCNSIGGWSILAAACDNCSIRVVASGRVGGATPA